MLIGICTILYIQALNESCPFGFTYKHFYERAFLEGVGVTVPK